MKSFEIAFNARYGWHVVRRSNGIAVLTNFDSKAAARKFLREWLKKSYIKAF